MNREQASEEFAAVWAETLVALPDAYGFTFSCSEAEAARAFLAAHGYDRSADALLAAHAEHDEPGEEHYEEPPGGDA